MFIMVWPLSIYLLVSLSLVLCAPIAPWRQREYFFQRQFTRYFSVQKKCPKRKSALLYLPTFGTKAAILHPALNETNAEQLARCVADGEWENHTQCADVLAGSPLELQPNPPMESKHNLVCRRQCGLTTPHQAGLSAEARRSTHVPVGVRPEPQHRLRLGLDYALVVC